MRLARLMLVVGVALLLAPFGSLALAHDNPRQSDGQHLLNDALTPPPPPPSLSDHLDPRGPSQFLAGRVAVRLVLPESNGGRDPSSEDWTPEQIAHVRAEVSEALSWWAAQLPLARLSFQLQVDLVPTAYEPISYGLADEGRWIGDALGNLGFAGDSYFDQAYDAAFSLRDELGADWATTIFLVNSTNGSAYFRDGYFAYAYVGGPFMVLTSDAGGYGTHQLAPIVAHELGHIFGALDQYYAARVPCDRRNGYLNAPTTNSQFGGCGSKLPSIMLEPLGAYASGSVDPSALAQVGYYDSDGDGTIDPLDTTPALLIEDATLSSGVGRPLLSGESRDMGFPSPLQPAVSINRVAQIEYRVPGGVWQPATADDGAFDEVVEHFSAELPLYDGAHTVELRAVNSAGAASAPVSRQVSVSGVGPQPDYRPSMPAFSRSAEVQLDLVAPADTQAVQVGRDPGFVGAPWQPYSPTLSHRLDGATGSHRLFVRFRDAAGLVSLAYALDTMLDTSPPAGQAVLDSAEGRLLLSAEDDISGVAAVEIRSAHGDAVWLDFQPVVALAAGHDAAAVRFRDSAGNISPVYQVVGQHRLFLPLVVN